MFKMYFNMLMWLISIVYLLSMLCNFTAKTLKQLTLGESVRCVGGGKNSRFFFVDIR